MGTDVYLEVGPKRTFACAVDWPGWCRSGKGEEPALEALASYAARYQAAMGRSRLAFTAPRGVDELVVVQHMTGNATTDFGAPGIVPAADERPVDDLELERLRQVLEAAWKAFDAAARAGQGRQLSVGPRGGGRSLDKIIEHVTGAEVGYVRQLGSRLSGSGPGGQMSSTSNARRETLEALSARARGEALSNPTAVKRPWPPRYFVRRASWHLLDHAWEVEDRLLPPGG